MGVEAEVEEAHGERPHHQPLAADTMEHDTPGDGQFLDETVEFGLVDPVQHALQLGERGPSGFADGVRHRLAPSVSAA